MTYSMSSTAICSLLDGWLRPQGVSDYCVNGLQYPPPGEVRALHFALDPAEEVLARCSEQSLLICHHALIWGKIGAIDERLRRKLSLLHEKRIGLYVSHLPLDAHQELGTGASLARRLGLDSWEPFGSENGLALGVRGEFARALTPGEFLARLREATGNGGCQHLHGRAAEVRRVGIVTGGAGNSFLEQAVAAGLDAFVTGEPRYSFVLPVAETGLHVFTGGHYGTEIWAMHTLCSALSREYPELPCSVVEAATGW